jgi:UDP-sulfoquinovose synthase
VIGAPLTVYGTGGQRRSFLNLRDTLQCVRIAAENPADRGEFRVFNQFTEVFSVLELAERVHAAAAHLGYETRIDNIENPRVELEEHYYNPRNDALLALGLEPRLLSDELVETMLAKIAESADRIDRDTILPRIRWRSDAGVRA